MDWLGKQKIPSQSLIFFQEPTSVFLIVKLLACLEAGMIACLINPKIPSKKDMQITPILLKLNWPNEHSIKQWALTKSQPAKKKWNLSQPSTIIFTSGTSGTPKGALHSLGNHYYSALGSNSLLSINSSDAWNLSLPLHHISGLSIVFRCLLAGACIQLDNNEKTTHVSWVNKQLFEYFKKKSNYEITHAIFPKRYKAILLGGGPINKNLIKKALKKKMPLYLSYGMTEMSSQVYTEKLILNGDKVKAKGRLLPYCKLKINSKKEIMVKGECLFMGYIKPSSSHGVIKTDISLDSEGWFHTLDLGEWVENISSLKINGRLDNMFISRGENIQPEMIEKKILEIENVEAVLVLPVPHDSHTHSIHAFIKHPSDLSRENIIKDYQSILPKHLWPEVVHPWPKEVKKHFKLKRSEFYKYLEGFKDYN